MIYLKRSSNIFVDACFIKNNNEWVFFNGYLTNGMVFFKLKPRLPLSTILSRLWKNVKLKKNKIWNL